MPKNKLIPVIVFISFLIIVINFYLLHKNTSFKDYNKMNMEINKKKFLLYVADDSQKKERGLSYIPFLKKDEGMIFIFDKPNYYSFWMKGMRFSLDFIFINNNEIVDFIENVKPDTFPSNFTSKNPADKVIEVNSGNIKKLKIEVNNKVKFF